VTIIGVGSLGSHICKALSEVSGVKKVIAFDHDIVTSRDILKTVYQPEDIGKHKVVALRKIFSNQVKYLGFAEKFKNGTELPYSNLVIDCRDFVTPKPRNVDIKIYIAKDFLVFNPKVDSKQEYVGEYTRTPTKGDLMKAGFIVASLVVEDLIPEIIKLDALYTLRISTFFKKVIGKSLEEISNNRLDLIHDVERVLNIGETINQIYKINQQSDLSIVYKDNKVNLDKCTFKQPEDVIDFFRFFPPRTKKNLILVIEQEQGKHYVEVIDEDGAA